MIIVLDHGSTTMAHFGKRNLNAVLQMQPHVLRSTREIQWASLIYEYSGFRVA